MGLCDDVTTVLFEVFVVLNVNKYIWTYNIAVCLLKKIGIETQVTGGQYVNSLELVP